MAITINQKGSVIAAKAPVVTAPKPASDRKSSTSWSFGGSVRSREVIFFTSQLSLMMEVGTSLTEALSALGDQTKNPAFKKVIRSMLKDVEEGNQLSDAMKRHPKLFSDVFVSMVKAGETGGFLKSILDRIVEMQEKRQELITQVRSALTYPVVLCVIGILVVVFILVSILPRFTSFFEGKEHILPFTTIFLMAASDSLRDYWWAYLVGCTGLGVGFKLFKNTELGGTLFDRIYVSAPILSRLFNKIYTTQLLRTLGHLMESKVNLIEALAVTRAAIANRYFRRFIDKIADHVEQGGKFSQPFAAYPYIMDTVKQMVSTADEAGNLPPVMLRLAEFYDTEVDQELKTLASIIEPLGLIVMGAVVGLIVSSVILPMFKLASAMH